jgi:hypothetical protein
MVESIIGDLNWPNEFTYQDTSFSPFIFRAVPMIRGGYTFEVQDSENLNAWHFVERYNGNSPLSILKVLNRFPKDLVEAVNEGRKEFTSLSGSKAPRWERESSYEN